LKHPSSNSTQSILPYQNISRNIPNVNSEPPNEKIATVHTVAIMALEASPSEQSNNEMFVKQT